MLTALVLVMDARPKDRPRVAALSRSLSEMESHMDLARHGWVLVTTAFSGVSHKNHFKMSLRSAVLVYPGRRELLGASVARAARGSRHMSRKETERQRFCGPHSGLSHLHLAVALGMRLELNNSTGAGFGCGVV